MTSPGLRIVQASPELRKMMDDYARSQITWAEFSRRLVLHVAAIRWETERVTRERNEIASDKSWRDSPDRMGK